MIEFFGLLLRLRLLILDLLPLLKPLSLFTWKAMFRSLGSNLGRWGDSNKTTLVYFPTHISRIHTRIRRFVKFKINFF